MKTMARLAAVVLATTLAGYSTTSPAQGAAYGRSHRHPSKAPGS
jgi:hypothetical protein